MAEEVRPRVGTVPRGGIAGAGGTDVLVPIAALGSAGLLGLTTGEQPDEGHGPDAAAQAGAGNCGRPSQGRRRPPAGTRAWGTAGGCQPCGLPANWGARSASLRRGMVMDKQIGSPRERAYLTQ